MAMLQDQYLRPLEDLRISVTDRCNFRCTYCMPFEQYDWIERSKILRYEEITRLARLFAQLGVRKIRLTGGEPLLRKDLDELVKRVAALPAIEDLCLTTNGSGLTEQAERLKAAGLRRINVSIDSLDPAKFRTITKRGNLETVLEGLFTAQRCGLQPIKINSVIERGVNDGEILDLVEFAREHGFGIRFIEYMDVGNANDWTSSKLVPKQEILEAVGGRYLLRKAGRSNGSAPAVDYEFEDGAGDVGVIASVTEPFCGGCTRARLTADGKIVTCLFSDRGHDVKSLLRGGASDDEILSLIRSIWSQRADRYSEERLVALRSSEGYRAQDHKKIEMISLGG